MRVPAQVSVCSAIVLFLWGAMGCIGLGGAVIPEQDAGAGKTRVALELSDQSRINGTLLLSSLSIQAGFGPVTLPVEKVSIISFHPGKKTVEVRLRNGDRISGVLRESDFPIETIFGKTILKADNIIKVSIFSPSFSGREGLVAYYPFNGDAADESGNGNNGEVVGASLTEDRFGIPDSAYGFDGQRSFIRVARSPSLNLGRQFTLSAWFNTRDERSQRPLVEWNDGGQFGLHMWINVPGWPGSGANIIGQDRSHHIISSTAFVSPNVWHHMAVTFDGSTGFARSYLDGNQVGSRELGPVTPLTLGDLFIGIRNNEACFKGVIDEVMVFNKALAPDEIRKLYEP